MYFFYHIKSNAVKLHVVLLFLAFPSPRISIFSLKRENHKSSFTFREMIHLFLPFP